MSLPASFNFAEHLFALNRGRAQKIAYVDDRGKWYLKAKSYYSFGTTLHRVLERFHDADIVVATRGMPGVQNLTSKRVTSPAR